MHTTQLTPLPIIRILTPLLSVNPNRNPSISSPPEITKSNLHHAPHFTHQGRSPLAAPLLHLSARNVCWFYRLRCLAPGRHSHRVSYTPSYPSIATVNALTLMIFCYAVMLSPGARPLPRSSTSSRKRRPGKGPFPILYIRNSAISSEHHASRTPTNVHQAPSHPRKAPAATRTHRRAHQAHVRLPHLRLLSPYQRIQMLTQLTAMTSPRKKAAKASSPAATAASSKRKT